MSTGPPKEAGPDWHQDPALSYRSLPVPNHSSDIKHSATPRHPSRYAAVWRRGFTDGAISALRCAARCLPPDSWYELAQLAAEYESAHEDD